MRTQVAKQRKQRENGNLRPVEGWDATELPTYPPLLQVLKALEDVVDRDGIAEMGADYNDEDDDGLGLSIVWANYAYFTDGGGFLRDMWSWVAVENDHYYGLSLEGGEWRVPFTNPDAADVAACKLVLVPN